MAVNLASKYATKVDDRFKLSSLTQVGVNNDYDWAGVKTVKVYSIPTVAMSDYSRVGTARYGTPSELQDSVQEMALAKDRAFTFTIDKGNDEEQMGAKEAGKALRRQIDEVVLPEVDSYRIAKMIAKNGASASTGVTAENAYTVFLAATEALSDNRVPAQGRVAFVTPAFYKFIKLDNSFILGSEIGQKSLIKGQVGEVDGVPLVVVPYSYFPTNVSFVMTHKSACVAPQKLEDYITHKNPPGINGKPIAA